MTIRLSLGTFVFCGLSLASAGAPVAEEFRLEPTVVVELFTSQGCSSCPPADALLEELATQPTVIALSYHVDYWDYIGWPDTFGDEQNSNHQRAYASSWQSPRIYTPQLVVNGIEDVVGSREAEVATAIAAASLTIPVVLAVDDGMLSIDIEGQAGLDDATVWVVTFLDRASVLIERGENAGKTVDYSQVVTHRQVVAMWEPGSGTHVKLPLAELLTDGSNGLAVIVQHGGDGMPGAIIGAASYLQ